MSERLIIDGRAIEAAWWGRRPPGRPDEGATRVPIVMLHEGLGSVAMWKDTPDALHAATGHPVMAYSRWGHGASDPPRAPHAVSFMHEEAQHELPAVLDAAGIGSALLFGHSDGGSIALIFAATQPQRVPALVLEAPHVLVEDVSIASIEAMRRRWAETPLRQRLSRYHARPDVAFHGWCDVWLDPAFRSWNLEAFLPRITCPVLVIQGRDDQYGTLRQVDAIVGQVSGPVETLILDDCGHAPHVDQQQAVLKTAAEFIARVTA